MRRRIDPAQEARATNWRIPFAGARLALCAPLASRRAGRELRTRSSILFQVTSTRLTNQRTTVARRQSECESDRVCRRGLGARRLGAECNRPWIAVSLSEVLFMVLTTKRKITPSQLSRILGRQRPKSTVVRSDCFGSNGRTSPFQGSRARSGKVQYPAPSCRSASLRDRPADRFGQDR